MKLFYLIIPFIFYTTILFSQNYQTVNSGRIACFQKDYNYTAFIRVDSFKVQTDSVFYFPKGVQQSGEYCFMQGCSWIGDKVIIKNNGINLFFSRESDTITIKTKAILNESWLAMERKSTLKIFAKVIKNDTLTFLGIKDSVKTIGFTVYDNLMNPQVSNLNSLSIMISKNFGLIKTLNFSLFPDFKDYSISSELQECVLIGLSNPKLGEQNLTWMEVFDFQVGDELHVTNTYNFVSNEETISKYIGRIDYSDSIEYTIDRKQKLKKGSGLDAYYIYIHDTIKLKINSNTEFDKLAGEPVINDVLKANKQTVEIRPTKYLDFLNLIKYTDTCWQLTPADGCFSIYQYKKGLGGPYYECNDIISMTFEAIKLVYYKKGIETWGTPLVIDKAPLIKNSEIKLYPNPLKDKLYLKINLSKLPCTLELIDITGRKVMNKVIFDENTTIDISKLKGVYLYQLIRKEQVINSGKLIIK